jgi:NAD(P)H dehydrogenase (quinone)
MKVLIPFYSLYYQMALAVAEGVAQVEGAEAVIRRVPETLPAEVIEKMGAVEAQKSLADIPVCTVDELEKAGAIIFGTPTRFGNMWRSDATVSGCYREVMAIRRTGWQGGKCVCKYRFTAWRPGNHNNIIPYYPVSPWYGSCRASICFSRSVALG